MKKSDDKSMASKTNPLHYEGMLRHPGDLYNKPVNNDKPIDIQALHTLFEYNGVLYETVSRAEGIVVGIKPVRAEDQHRCEHCGTPLADQVKDFVYDAPILQNKIGKVLYIPEK